MIFNPEESIDFHGFTGPFVQYTHARIKSILRKEKHGNEEVTINSRQQMTSRELFNGATGNRQPATINLFPSKKTLLNC